MKIVEVYKDIEGYEGLYQVSNLGNVKSFHTGKEKILKPNKNTDNYLQVDLYKQGKRKQHLVHRLVGKAFIDNPNNYEQINHRDENPLNNNVSNLEYCDCKYNNNYGTRIEKISKQVLCVETGVVYASTNEVERRLGFAHSHISKCCNGKRKTCGGYRWQYVS